jgi:hypothetical protein
MRSSQVTDVLTLLTERLELAEQLRSGRQRMFDPQDLPGRFGRVIRALDHVLKVLDLEAVVGGGWAVWRHGYQGRLTQDVDIVLPADRVEEFLRVSTVSGFEVLARPAGRWPKLRHRDTDVQVGILPEGARPGTSVKPAPTTIPHPARLGAERGVLRYMGLSPLIELKLAAGRARDEADVVELIRVNQDRIDTIRQHLATVHPAYVDAFGQLVERALEQQDS